MKNLEKIEDIEPPRQRKTVHFDFRSPPRSGEDVAKLAGVTKRYGPKTIYDGFDWLVRRGERWCVMGKNGAGKTTLLRLVAGQSEADAGKVTIGASVKMGYFAQHAMDVLDAEHTVLETLQRTYALATQGTLRTLLGAFGFSGDDVEKKVKVLSGGEKRARVVLATMLYDPPNFLVLDEPTNHLDLWTKEMLMEALRNFEGTMLFVSLDRQFLRALTNRVLVVTPEGVRSYGGGYGEYVEQTGHEAPGALTSSGALPGKKRINREIREIGEERRREDRKIRKGGREEKGEKAGRR